MLVTTSLEAVNLDSPWHPWVRRRQGEIWVPPGGCLTRHSTQTEPIRLSIELQQQLLTILHTQEVTTAIPSKTEVPVSISFDRYPLPPQADEAAITKYCSNGYGRGVAGLPLIYSDGAAYLGLEPPQNASIATNVTLTQDANDGSFAADPINSTIPSSNWTSPKLAIDTSVGAFEPVSFSVGENASLTTTGFDMWGSLLVWISDSGVISTKWYASPVDAQNKTWLLKWNVENAASETAIPIILKSLAPVDKKMR
ncbi:hypothetical protein Slin15195_G032590 [Septoria linicola]|uniref:Uncharacterized protein n=1 Tax=Septoria linicola TaxID=215465 RepID=A0A9Q9AJ10_9PEZI|nr:hypothetical protein Slin14017_G031620 [Septoria linicola]USW49940.1 hypothetical protein Slin15195_G032590 [Septoria linicola]